MSRRISLRYWAMYIAYTVWNVFHSSWATYIVCVCVWCTSSHRCIGGRKVWLYLHTHVSSLNLVSLTNLKWSSVPSHLVMSFSGHSRQDCRFADNVCLHDVSAIQVYHSVHNYCIWCTRYSKLTVSRPSFSEQRDTAMESMANTYSSPSPRCYVGKVGMIINAK